MARGWPLFYHCRLAPTPLKPDTPSWLISSVWVRAKNRRRGIARQLLNAITSAAQSDHIRLLRLWIVEGNADAEALYRTPGFLPTGRREARSPLNPDVFIVEFSLSI
jgi:GNAT superfamily N-acetyltransferase